MKNKMVLASTWMIVLCFLVIFTIVLSKPLNENDNVSLLSRKLIKPEKRWDGDLFGHGCRCGFELHCHSDNECQLNGHTYECVSTCCGTMCEYHNNHVSAN